MLRAMLPLAGCLPRLLDFQPHFGEAQTLPVDRGRGGPIAQELDSVIRRTGPALPKATEGIVRWGQLLFSLRPDGNVMSQISLLTVKDFPWISSLIYALTQQTRCLYQTHSVPTPLVGMETIEMTPNWNGGHTKDISVGVKTKGRTVRQGSQVLSGHCLQRGHCFPTEQFDNWKERMAVMIGKEIRAKTLSWMFKGKIR